MAYIYATIHRPESSINIRVTDQGPLLFPDTCLMYTNHIIQYLEAGGYVMHNTYIEVWQVSWIEWCWLQNLPTIFDLVINRHHQHERQISQIRPND
jgi:hypothetical protein